MLTEIRIKTLTCALHLYFAFKHASAADYCTHSAKHLLNLEVGTVCNKLQDFQGSTEKAASNAL